MRMQSTKIKLRKKTKENVDRSCTCPQCIIEMNTPVNAETAKILQESFDDIKAGRISPGFSNARDAIAWLNSHPNIDKNEIVLDRIGTHSKLYR